MDNFSKNESLAIKARLGNREALQQLTLANMGLLYHFCHRYGGTHRPEELLSTAFAGFLRAIEHFDPARGRFSLPAGAWIRAAVSREQTVERNYHKPLLSLDAPTGKADLTYGEIISEETPGQEVHCERKDLLRKAITTLLPRERTIIRMRFFDDLTLEETGVALGITGSRASQIEKTAIEKMRARIG